MKRIHGLFPAIFALSLLASCSMNVADKPQSDPSALNAQKIEAAKQLDAATAEFYDGLGTTEADVALKNSIIAEAWTAYYTGDTATVTKLLKDNGLYEKYEGITKKYSVAAKNAILATHADGSNRAVSSSWFATLADGDILLAYGGSSSGIGIGILIPGTWKHSGLYSSSNRYGGDDEYRIASASNQTSHGFAAGWETRAKWTGESGVQSRKIRNVSGGAINAAFSYIMSHLGQPYKLSARNDESSWYCSKLVWKAFKNQGYDLEPPPAWFDGYVTPQDIHDDNDTYFVSGDLN